MTKAARGCQVSDSLFPSLLTFSTSSGYSHDSKVRAKIKKELPRGLAHEGSAVDACSDFSQMEFLHVPKPSSCLRFFQQEVCPTTLPELRTSAVHSLLLRVTLVSPTNTQQSESAPRSRVIATEPGAAAHPWAALSGHSICRAHFWFLRCLGCAAWPAGS